MKRPVLYVYRVNGIPMSKKTGLCLALLFSLLQATGQRMRIDSLTRLLSTGLQQDTLDTNRIRVMIELAYEYHRADPDKGLQLGQRALQNAEIAKWKNGVAMASNRIGLCYWAKSNFPKALEYHFKALSIYEQTGNKKGIAVVLGNIGLVYDGQQNYAKALEYHFKSYEINDQLGEKSGVARNMGNIGMAYDALADYDRSLEYYFKALHMYQMLNDSNGIARNLGNIGFVYNEKRDHLKALEYHFRALAMNRMLGDRILTAANLGNLGEEYYNIAVDTSAAWLKIVPDSLRKPRVLDASERYLNEAIALYAGIGDLNGLRELYEYLSDLQNVRGNCRESLVAFKRSVLAKDSLFSAANRGRIEELEKNREEDLKQKQIELLRSQNEVESLVAQRRRAFNYGMGIAVLLLGAVAFYLYRQNRRREKMNQELQQAYTDLKNMQQQLLESEQRSVFLTMATRMAHEIQNPLNFVNNLSETAGEMLEEFSAATDETDRKAMQASIREMLQAIHHHGNRIAGIITLLFRHMREGTTHQYFEENRGR